MNIKDYFINLGIRKVLVKRFRQICICSKIEVKSAVFVSRPDFADNIYPLFIELKKRGYKCLWVLFDRKSIHVAKKLGAGYLFNKKSMRNMYKLSKYHYVFYSHSMPYMYDDKSGQKYYNLWHGSPFKMYHGVLLDNKGQNYFFVPSGNGSRDLYLKYYSNQLCSKRCLSFRHFRTDYFKNDFQHEETQKAIDYFDLTKYSKVIVVCLTWIRDKEVNESTNHLLGFPLDREEFSKLNGILCDNHIILIIKPHPGQKVKDSFTYSNIRVVSSTELTSKSLQLYSLIGICDLLLTDYSSILFDFALLDKPVGHIIHHWDYFTNNEHEKFIYENPEEVMFGTRINNFSELCDYIQNPKNNDDNKQKMINEKYNSDPELKESSTIKFINNILKE